MTILVAYCGVIVAGCDIPTLGLSLVTAEVIAGYIELATAVFRAGTWCFSKFSSIYT